MIIQNSIFAYICLSALPIYAVATYTETVNGITWTYMVENGKASIGGGSDSSPAVPISTSGAITIPSTLRGNIVTSIGSYAFRSCSRLTSVMVPGSVTNIGYAAFNGCRGLTSVTIPDSVTSIGEAAFAYCSGLTSVTIPDSVTRIGACAFAECYKLKNLTIPDSVTSIGSGAFEGCSSLGNVSILSSRIELGSGIFDECSKIASVTIGQSVCMNGLSNVFRYSHGTITNIVISEGVTSIGSLAFSDYRGLKSVTIPGSVTNVGASAFSGCTNLAHVCIDDLAAWCRISFEYDGNPLYYAHNLCVNGILAKYLILPDDVTDIKSYAFSGCTNLTSVTIPNSVTSIGSYAFMDCSGLTNVTIPDSVTNIGYMAFYNCSGLTSVTLPDGVTSIGAQAFYNCSGLTSVTIPDSVTSIGWDAFRNCSGLTSVTIPDSVINIGSSAFDGVPFYENQPDGLVVFGKVAYKLKGNCPESVTIPDGVTSIGAQAFYNCNGLTSVMIPDSVTNIGISAFYNCSGLTSVTIPDSVTSIGGDAFFGCDGLTSVTIPDGVTSIGNSAFFNCSGLTSVTIPGSVTNVGSSAFYGCTNLMSVCIGDLAAWCGISFEGSRGNPLYYAHNLCVNGALVDNVTIPSGVTSIGDYTFYGCTNFTHVTMPSSVTSIGDYTFYGCSNLTHVTIPDSVTSIGSSAFDGIPFYENQSDGVVVFGKVAYKLKGICPESVTIPDGVTSIGNSAFYNCSDLTSITIPDSVTNIGISAFYNCSGLTRVTIPGGVKSIGYAAFYGCSGLTSVTILDGVTSIGSRAFWGCSGLTSVTIPCSVTNIENRAFNGCDNLTDVYIDDLAAWCKMSVAVSSADPLSYAHNLHVNGELITELIIPDGVTSIRDYAFRNCTNLTCVTIPEGVTNIGKWAFLGCHGLRSITLPLWFKWKYDFTQEVVGYPANVNITYYDVPRTVTFNANGGMVSEEMRTVMCGSTVGILPTPVWADHSFVGWRTAAMSGGWIVDTTKVMGDVTYYAQWAVPCMVTLDQQGGNGGTSSVTATYGSAMPSITVPTRTGYTFGGYYTASDGMGTRYYTGSGTSAKIWDRANAMTLYAKWISKPPVEPTFTIENGTLTAVTLNGATEAVIPSSVTYVGAKAFYGCSGLTSVTIPDSVTIIGTNAFRNCSGLESVKIGSGVKTICNSAFHSCGALVDMTIPDGVERIENFAFAYCGFSEVVIPDSVKFLGPSSFAGCGELVRVTVGSGLTSLGGSSFKDCVKLANIVFKGNAPKLGSGAFSGVASECCVYVRRASSGWGVSIPGTWNGLAITYIRPVVTFDANGGMCAVASLNVTDGTMVGALPVPTRAGFRFIGWFTAAEGGGRVEETTVISENMTLYAHWVLSVTLAEALDVSEGISVATSETVLWTTVLDASSKVGGVSARSGEIGDKTNTWLSATVEGVGTMAFWCKTSCEHDEDGTFMWDRLMVYTNGVEIVEWRMDGETDWTRREVSFAGGKNTVKWVYYKDKSGVGGEDCAWVDGVMWTLTDPIPPIVSDSEVLTALTGTTDVNLTVNVTNAAQYAAYRNWALSVTNGTTTAQMIKESTRTWLSFALGADALIGKELTSDDVKIESFTSASSDGKFEFTVSVKDVNIGGGSVAAETLKENLKKVLCIEGATMLSSGAFSSDNIDITFDTPVDGKARLTVTPPVDAGNSFFMRVKVK